MHVSFHRFPPKSEPAKCKRWLLALGLSEGDIADHHRICSQHFPNGDSSQTPSLHLGKKFRSPKKVWTARAQRAAKRRSTNTEVPTSKRHLHCSLSPAPTVTPASSEQTDGEDSAPGTRMYTPISEVLLGDYSVCELPSGESALDTSDVSGSCTYESSTSVIVNVALVARIEALKAENKELHCQLSSHSKPFRLSSISHSDPLVYFYTGFQSHELLLIFFNFLVPVVNELNYWGSTKKTAMRKRKTKLDPLNHSYFSH